MVRFNYALHGEPNGVVLDNGDFVHLRPGGMRASGLEIGDEVRAAGPARALQFGGGRAIEAREVNGKPIEPHAKSPRPAAKKIAPRKKAGASRDLRS